MNWYNPNEVYLDEWASRQEKIDAIYKEMANKKRTFGCRCRINDGEDVIFIRKNKTWSYLSIRENEEFTVSLWYTPEIIWHPVMIGDVIAYLRKDYDTFVEWKPEWDTRHYWNGKYYKALLDKIIYTWELFRKPIEDQSDECIDYVYSLIPSKSME